MIVEMQKLTLIGLISERDKILRALMKSKVVEIIKTEDIDGTKKDPDYNRKDYVTNILSRLDFVFNFLTEASREAATLREEGLINYEVAKKPLFASPVVMDTDAFEKIGITEYELLHIVGEIEQAQNRLNDIKAEQLHIKSLNEQLKPYEAFVGALNSYRDSARCLVALGSVQNEKSAVLLSALENAGAVVEYHEGLKNTALCVLALKEEKEKIENALISADFIKSNQNLDVSAAQKISELDRQSEMLDLEKNVIIEKTMGYLNNTEELHNLYDFYLVESQKTDVSSNFSVTEKAFVLNGWVPKAETNRVKDALTAVKAKIEIDFQDPLESEDPPTLTVNNKFVSPYESVTNMYSAPNYRETDPNPGVAIAFVILFGLMLSDAAYGAILSIATLVIIKLKKPLPGQASMLWVLFMGGISTIIWGVLFGSYFGISVPNPPLFNALEKPLNMLVLCLGLGILHILLALGIDGFSKIKKKKYIEALFTSFPWFFIFGGGAIFALTLLGIKGAKLPGIIIALFGVGLMMCGGAFGKKGIFKKITGALGSLYGMVNYLSDILSYARLFALGLATGVIAMVVNILGGVIAGFFPENLAFLGWILATPILIIGHVFNIGINVLGTYVHNSRLQYIEFFSHFYSGGGHLFSPFGSKLKYINIIDK